MPLARLAKANPDFGTDIKGLGHGIWWSAVTMTTVGYGDFRPSMKTSRILAVVLAFVGIVFAGIVVAMALHSADYAYGLVYKEIGL